MITFGWEVAGKPIVEIGREGLKTISPYIEKVVNNRLNMKLQFRLKGSPYLHIVYTLDWDEQGMAGWFASIVNTERRRMEEALSASSSSSRDL
jgi:hypothetical protein